MEIQDQNYLLFALSRLSRAQSIWYQAEGDPVKYMGIQTNEAVTKYLFDYLYSNNKKLSKIIMLCSKEVQYEKLPSINQKTTLEYYQEAIKTFIEEKYGTEYINISELFEVVPYAQEDNGEAEIVEPLKRILEVTGNAELDGNKHLYIDFTGGIRSAALTLLFSCRILQRSGITVEKIWYSNITAIAEQSVGSIEECTKTYQLFEYLEALVEQEYGETKRTINYVNKALNENEKKAVQDVLKGIGREKIAKKENKFKEVADSSINVQQKLSDATEKVKTTIGKNLLENLNLQTEASRKIARNSEYTELYLLEECLQQKNYDKALYFFREKIVGPLHKCGILRVHKRFYIQGKNDIKESDVMDEILGVYSYYEVTGGGSKNTRKSFMDAVKQYICLLKDNIEQDPLEIFMQMIEKYYDLQKYLDFVPYRAFAHNSYSHKISLDKISSYLETAYGSEIDLQQFMESYWKLDHIYMCHGFPFACTYGKWFFDRYDDIYQRTFRMAAESLQRFFEGTADNKIQKILQYFPEQEFTYKDLIAILADPGQKKILRILFPFQLKNSDIGSNLLKGSEWDDFIYNFARISYAVKSTRNKYAHLKDLEREGFRNTVQEIEQVVAHIKKHIEM